MNRVRSAYQDEDRKIEDEYLKQVELWCKVENLLDLYGYEIDIKMVNNLPELTLIKR